MTKYQTIVVVWSNIGHTPLTNRAGACCDELVRVTIECKDHAEALQKTKQMIRETMHGHSGHFRMVDYPNQNLCSRFTH